MQSRYTLYEIDRELGRELGMRRDVYPRAVQRGKLSESRALQQIAMLEEARRVLRLLQAAGPHIRRSDMAGQAEVAELLQAVEFSHAGPAPRLL